MLLELRSPSPRFSWTRFFSCLAASVPVLPRLSMKNAVPTHSQVFCQSHQYSPCGTTVRALPSGTPVSTLGEFTDNSGSLTAVKLSLQQAMIATYTHHRMSAPNKESLAEFLPECTHVACRQRLRLPVQRGIMGRTRNMIGVSVSGLPDSRWLSHFFDATRDCHVVGV